MALLRTLLGGREGAPRAATIDSPSVPVSSSTILDFIGRTSSPSSAGVAVTEQSSLGMPAVWRAVNVIAGSCAALPLHAYSQPKPADPPQPVPFPLIDDPHPDLTRFELFEIVYTHLALWGNAYLQKLKDQAGTVRELWPIHPSRVRAGRDALAGMAKVYVIDGDMENPRTDREILHIPGFGYDGVTGVSPIRAARNSVGLALAAEDYGGRLFKNGSLASGILQAEQRLTKEQSDGLRDRWRDRAQGLENAHEVVVLDSGAKFQQLTIPPEDAQFIESRRFQIAEVARMFGVPAHMLSDTEKQTSWGTGIEQMSIGFVKFTLQPWLIRVEQRISKHLMSNPRYVRYVLEGLLRGDTESRYRAYTQAINWGILSRNEVRALEERPPVEGGDEYLIPLNMGLASAVGDAAPTDPADPQDPTEPAAEPASATTGA